MKAMKASGHLPQNPLEMHEKLLRLCLHAGVTTVWTECGLMHCFVHFVSPYMCVMCYFLTPASVDIQNDTVNDKELCAWKCFPFFLSPKGTVVLPQDVYY